MPEKTTINNVVLACATYKRPQMLNECLESLRHLIIPENLTVQVLIIDNDENETAKIVTNEKEKDFPFKIHCITEKTRGLAAVRNTLVNEAIVLGASHVAMFDDDEILDKNWLIAHVNLYNRLDDVQISSGPTYVKFLGDYPQYIRKNNIFKSTSTKKTGQYRKTCASGNVFFPTTITSESGICFDERFNFMGGEDGDFFERAQNAGFKIAWNAEAINFEMIDESRANLTWILKRYFFNGYKSSYLNNEKHKNTTKRLFYITKLVFVLLLNILILIPSLIFGLTLFCNIMGMGIKTYGKIAGLLNNERPDYYQNATGS